MTTRKGFTLLELLVVIGIIGVLVALGTVAYSGAQKKARDARRKADMKSIQGALEVYYSENSYVYPTTCSSAETYLKGPWPTDPVNNSGTGLVYTEFCDADSYYVCAGLETQSGNTGALPTDANGSGIDWGGSIPTGTPTPTPTGTPTPSSMVGGYYCVSNLQ